MGRTASSRARRPGSCRCGHPPGHSIGTSWLRHSARGPGRSS
jgi:hypothetical protein